jgi:hypothetical protein
MRQLLGLRPAGNRFASARAPEIVADGAPFERTEFRRPHVAGIVAERVEE